MIATRWSWLLLVGARDAEGTSRGSSLRTRDALETDGAWNVAQELAAAGR